MNNEYIAGSVMSVLRYPVKSMTTEEVPGNGTPALATHAHSYLGQLSSALNTALPDL
jgi:hypothetical protein